MSQSAIDLALKNWHAAETRCSTLEVALKNVLRMPTVPPLAKAIIREALATLVVPPQDSNSAK